MISHKALFDKLRDTTVIAKCTQYAHWTLPQLMADVQTVRDGGRIVVERDYQEVGALLVNNLATKLARILFPTGHPFFKAELSSKIIQQAEEEGISATEIPSMIAKAELTAASRLFMNASYAQLILALKHLIVTGNVLLYRDSDLAKCSAYGLQSFSIKRDGRGTMMDCVLREFTYVEALPEDVQQLLRTVQRERYSRPECSVELYTRIHRSTRNGVVGYEVTQAVDTTTLSGVSWYPEHLCPWIAPTWSIIPGEHYGRGMVEDYAGGFAKLSDLSEAHALYGIEIMRVIHLVSAASGTDIDDIARAETGEYVRGDPATVQAHESGDALKLEHTSREIERVFGRLSKAFMYQASVRDAERVTAYELRRDAEEAENALGGVYSTLSDGLQTPLAHLLLYEAVPEILPGLITQEVKPNVIAGIPALGRTGDVQNLLMAAQEASAIIALVQVDQRINPERLMDVIYAGRSVDTSKFNYTPAELKRKQEAEAQQQAGMMQMQEAALAAETAGTVAKLGG